MFLLTVYGTLNGLDITWVHPWLYIPRHLLRFYALCSERGALCAHSPADDSIFSKQKLLQELSKCSEQNRPNKQKKMNMMKFFPKQKSCIYIYILARDRLRSASHHTCRTFSSKRESHPETKHRLPICLPLRVSVSLLDTRTHTFWGMIHLSPSVHLKAHTV